MSLYNDASLLLIPSGYKSGTVYSQKPTDGSGDLTFTRASDATRVNSDGLIEKVRTNLLQRSEEFNNVIWGKIAGTTVTANQTTAPNGTNTADLITEGAAVLLFYSTVIPPGTYTQSWYLKKGTGDIGGMYFGSGFSATYNLTSGTVVSTNNATATITDVGNGWYRCTATASPTASFYTGLNYINSSGLTIYAWGAQLETGDIATDYIPTTTAAVSVGMTANVPRLDYTNNSCPALLLEPQRTNLALYSEQFDNAAWTKNGVTVTANNTQSPDGYQNADKVTNATTSDFISQIILAPTATAYAASFYIKNEDATTTAILVRNAATGLGGNINWNGSELVSISNVTNGTLTFESVGNNWYRIFGSFTSIETVQRVRITPDTTTSGKSVYVWGYQLEQNAAYATSYIPTLGTTVTRVADAASKTGISDLIGQTEGTLFFEFEGPAQSNVYYSLSNGVLSNSIIVGINPSGLLNARIFNPYPSIAINLGSFSYTAGQRYKVAFSYSSVECLLAVNGVVVSSTGFAGFPAGTLTRLGIDNSNTGSQPILGNHSQVLLFKTRLSNTELAELTTL